MGKPAFDIGDLKPGEYRDVTFSFYTNRRIANGQPIHISLKLTESRAPQNVLSPLPLTMNVPQRRIHEVVVAGKQVASPVYLSMPTALAIDVDTVIPDGEVAGRYDVAVIIGNANYHREGVPNVDYAHRDVGVLEQYLLKTMGFSQENILVAKDATKGEFETLFGTKDHVQGKLWNYVKPNVSRIFVYYVGHGAPSTRDGQSFFVPVDADPDYIHSSGYALSTFYQNIEQIPAKEKIIIIDACFSGNTPKGLLFKNVSPALVKVKATAANVAQGAVLSSSQAEQLSTWFPEKKHSLFTYYFLKGLQGNADANQDRQITMGEMADYVNEHVPYQARRLAGKEQQPKIEGQRDLILTRLKER